MIESDKRYIRADCNVFCEYEIGEISVCFIFSETIFDFTFKFMFSPL